MKSKSSSTGGSTTPMKKRTQARIDTPSGRNGGVGINRQGSSSASGVYRKDRAKRVKVVGQSRDNNYAGAEGPKKSSPRPSGLGKGGGKGTPGNKRGR